MGGRVGAPRGGVGAGGGGGEEGVGRWGWAGPLPPTRAPPPPPPPTSPPSLTTRTRSPPISTTAFPPCGVGWAAAAVGWRGPWVRERWPPASPPAATPRCSDVPTSGALIGSGVPPLLPSSSPLRHPCRDHFTCLGLQLGRGQGGAPRGHMRHAGAAAGPDGWGGGGQAQGGSHGGRGSEGNRSGHVRQAHTHPGPHPPPRPPFRSSTRSQGGILPRAKGLSASAASAARAPRRRPCAIAAAAIRSETNGGRRPRRVQERRRDRSRA